MATEAEVADRAAQLRPSRRTTKRVVIGLLLWSSALLTVIVMIGEPESRLLETIAVGLLALIGSLVGLYIGGGAWDFRNVLKAAKEK